MATGEDVVLVPLYSAAPLLATLGSSLRATILVGVAAVVAAVIVGIGLEDYDTSQGAVRFITVGLAANLAAWATFLRERLQLAADRQRFLAEAGEILAASPDYRDTLRRVAELAVPRIADWSAVDLLGRDGQIERVAVAHTDPAKVAYAHELQARYPASLEDPTGLGKVLRTGEPDFIPEIPEELIEAAARDEEHLRVIRELRLSGGLTVPLVARERTLGALTWVTERGRTMTREDFALARELARRCAVAIDNARLLDETRVAQAELNEAFGLLDVLFERAPVGLAFFDTDYRYVRINERLAEINGVPAPEHVGRTVYDVLPNMDPDVELAFRRVVDEGEPIVDSEVVGETPAQPGVKRTWLLSCWPVRRRGSDAIIGVGAVVVEVTAERAAASALRAQTDRYETLLLALSEVGEGMLVLEDEKLVYANPAFEAISGYALDELRTMEDVFSLVVPGAQDEARDRARARTEDGAIDPNYSVSIRRRDGRLVELEIAGVPLEIDERRQLVIVARDISERRRVEAERETALRQWAFLAESGERFDEVLDVQRTLQIAADLAVREFADQCTISLRGSALSASAGIPREEVVVVVDQPVRARGQLIGMMTLGYREQLSPEREAEIESVFGVFTRRAGLALDNARLYQERSAVARTLQRSLLPPDLPAVPGVQLAARYVASGEGNEVGGDFYDCFSTGEDEWAVVIGDVCGKGAEAAAITALARYTIRASVLHSRDPRHVLRELNEVILRQGLEYRFATVLYGTLRPRPGALEAGLATGGHPLPLLLRADGSVEAAGRQGALMGIMPDPHIGYGEATLGPGDALVLYTDGVIEATPTDDRFGPERLETFLSQLAGKDAAEIARAIEDEVLDVQGGAPRDDVAILVLRVLEPLPGRFAAGTAGVAATA